jgi:hypothetical protein
LQIPSWFGTNLEGHGEGDALPSGRLKPGFVRVAGVVTDDAYRELFRFMLDRGYPTVSRALGGALEGWMEARRKGVLHLVDPPIGEESVSPDSEVVHPTNSQRERI